MESLQTAGADAPREDVPVARVEYWARVPEWVLYAPISDRAVRLYGVLARHAKSDGTGADPGRARLARLLRCSPSSLDRARRELETVEAIEVDRYRLTAQGDWDTNHYRLRFKPPLGLVTSDQTPSRQRTDRIVRADETGLVTGDEQTRATLNESQMNDAPCSPPQAGDAESGAIDALLEAFYEATGTPAASTRSEVRSHRRPMKEIREVGGTPDEIRAAVDAWVSKYDLENLNPKVLAKWWGLLMRTARDGSPLIDCGGYRGMNRNGGRANGMSAQEISAMAEAGAV